MKEKEGERDAGSHILGTAPEHLPVSSGLGILMSVLSPQSGKVSVETSKTEVLNLWVTTPLGLHIRYPPYQISTL